MTKQAKQEQAVTTEATQTTKTNETNENQAVRMTETEFRIAILSRSGNVGKTTLARLLLAPRMEDAGEIIYIETTNADKESKEGKMVRAAQFEKVAQKIGESMSTIVDIGASNIEETMQLMKQIEGSHEDFDYILIPVIKSPKQREDSINTFVELINMGVEPERIKVVFNRVNVTESVDEEFADVIFALKKLGIEYNENAVVYESGFFPKIHDMKITLDELFAVPMEEHKARQNDLRRMKQRSKEESDELSSLTNRITLQRNALSAITNLDNVYEALFTK